MTTPKEATHEALPEPLKLPMLPRTLLNTIGEYGMARTDRVSELTVQYRWEMLIAGIKEYAAALLESERQAHAAEVAALKLQLEVGPLYSTRLKAKRYDWLRSGALLRQGVPICGHRAIERNRLQSLMTFQFWCSPNELDAAIDQAIARGKT